MLTIQHILSPVEFDQHFEEVAQGAVQVALKFQGHLHFLHVDDPLAGVPSLIAGSIHTQAYTEEKLARKVAEFVPGELLAAVHSSCHVRRGDTVKQILRFAVKHGVDLIVIGNSRRSLIAGLFFSSIQEEVIHRAPCHVLTLNLRKK